MQRITLTLATLAFLTGCAQPQIDQPQVNGSYLVIEGEQAWAVHVQNGKRTEEKGLVVDVIKAAGQQAAVAASYVIETPNCGRMQWLTERSDAADGITSLMLLRSQSASERADCVLAHEDNRLWTVLDYSI